MRTRDLVSTASEPYRNAGRFAYHFARCKLGMDPMFDAILRHGLLERRANILDLGCGQGLLAALLLAARGAPDNRQPWAFRGIDCVARYVERARLALNSRVQIVLGDVRRADFGTADGIVLLDVLHYIDYAEQRSILERAHGALAADGILLMRIGDADGGLPFWLGTCVDRMVSLAGGHRLQRLHCRSTTQWRELLHTIGFASEAVPMSAGTPFANVLIIARPR